MAVTIWLLKLESVYNEVIEYKLPEVQGLHAHYALIAAIINIDFNFSYD
jgi:hypothetical protein